MSNWTEEVERLRRFFETKVRRVRSAEGVERYGQPMGTIIKPGMSPAAAGRPRRGRGGNMREGLNEGGIPVPRAPVRPRPPKRATAKAPAKRTPAPKKTAKPPVDTGAVKIDRRTTQGQTKSNFVHPDTGASMGKTETGDTFEQMFKAKMQESLEEKFGCCLTLITGAGEGTARNTPLDFKIGKRGGEVKTLSARAKNQKTAIKKEEIERKINALKANPPPLKPLLVVQVVDQDTGKVSVYGHPEFASKAVKAMTLLGNYDFTPDDFMAAQQASGHWDKRTKRAADEAKKKAETKSALGQEYDPPDEEGGIIEPGDTVIELRDNPDGTVVPWLWTEGAEGAEEEAPEEDDDEDTELDSKTGLRHVRTPEGARRYGLPIGSPIRPGATSPDLPRSPWTRERLLDVANNAEFNWVYLNPDLGLNLAYASNGTHWSGQVVEQDDGSGWRWTAGGYDDNSPALWSTGGVEEDPDLAVRQVQRYIRENADELRDATGSLGSLDDDLAAADAALARQAQLARNIPERVGSPEFQWQHVGRTFYGSRVTPYTSLSADVRVQADGRWRRHVSGYARQTSTTWSDQEWYPERDEAIRSAEEYMRSVDNNEARRQEGGAGSGTVDDILEMVGLGSESEPSPSTEPRTIETAQQLVNMSGFGFGWDPDPDRPNAVVVRQGRPEVTTIGRVWWNAESGTWRWQVEDLNDPSRNRHEETPRAAQAIRAAELTIEEHRRETQRREERRKLEEAERAMEEALRTPLPDDNSFWHFIEGPDDGYGGTSRTLHPEARQRLDDTYEGTFGDLSIKVTGARYSYGDLMIRGRIYDADDDSVGEWNVSIVDEAAADGGPPELKIDHGILTLESHVQAAGLATGWQMQLMGKYVGMGVRKVTTHADITVGGYSWAKAGFGWDPSGGKPYSVIDRLETAFGLIPTERWDSDTNDYIQVPRPPRFTNVSSEALEAARDIVERMRNLDDVEAPNYPTPQDIANLGRRTDLYERQRNANPVYANSYDDDDTVMTSWPGKDVLLGSDWYALAQLAYADTSTSP